MKVNLKKLGLMLMLAFATTISLTSCGNEAANDETTEVSEGGDKCEDGKCEEGKCEEGKCEEGKCEEGKCEAGKSSNKCEEGKCGEGKCGGGSTEETK